MRVSRRRFVGSTALGLLAASRQPARAQGARKTITWWYGRANSDNQAALDRAIVQPFNASQGEYTLQIDVRGAEIDRLLRVALLSGSGPDIVSTSGPTYLTPLALSGQLLPLDAYAARYGWNDRFIPALLDTGRFGGKLFSLPRTYESMSLFYNQPLFDQHGWRVPTTRAETEALAASMTEKGIQPFANGNADWKGVNEWIATVFLNHAAGPDNVARALRGELPWTAPAFVDAIELCKAFYQKGWFGKNYFSLTGEQAFLQVVKGQAGMSLNGTWAFQYGKYGLAQADSPIGVAPIPSLGDGVPAPLYVLGIGATLSIAKASANPDGAAAVLDFLLKPSTVKAINAAWAGKWNVPLRDLSVTDLADVTSPLFARTVGALKTAFEANRYGYTSWTFWPPATEQYLIDGLEQVWLDRATTAQYLGKLDQTFQQELKDGKVPPIPTRRV